MKSTMKFSVSRSILSATFVTGVALVSALPLQAEARSRGHTTSHTAANGQTAQRSATVNASPGYRDATRSQQGPNGGTRDVERGYDTSTGSAYRDVTATGPNGQTSSRGGSTSVSGGTASTTRAATGPYGSASSSATRSYDPASGAYTADISKTGPNGGSVTRETSAHR